MRQALATAVAVLAAATAPALAHAQDSDEAWQGDEAEMTPDAPGADENPDAPNTQFNPPKPRPPKADTPPPPPPLTIDKAAYPLEEVKRPITLPVGMFEATIALPFTVSPAALSGHLHAHFGVFDRAELGVRYGFGSVIDRSGNDFQEGKAFSIEAIYLIRRWIAAQLEVPIMVDPFAIGLTFGAPMRFQLFDRLTLTFGEDLVSVRLRRVVPIPELPVIQAAQQNAIATNTVQDDGTILLAGQAIFQFRPDLALDLRLGLRGDDFDLGDGAVIVELGAQYSTSQHFDVGARVGVTAIEQADDTFFATLFAALRL